MDDINDIQKKIRESKKSGNRPIAIWDAETANLWHAQDRATQKAWDDYANNEAQVEANCMDPDRSPNVMHNWRPPFTFEQWLVQYRARRDKLLWRPLDYYNSSTDFLTTRERFDHLSSEEIRLVKERQSLLKRDLETALGKSQNEGKPIASASPVDTSGSPTEVSPEEQFSNMGYEVPKTQENRISTLKRQNDLLIVENEKLKHELASSMRLTPFQLICFLGAALCAGALIVTILVSIDSV